jgi:hypothetical protein
LDRALVGVAPDGYERKQPSWRLATLVKALERHQGAGRAVAPVDEKILAETYRGQSAKWGDRFLTRRGGWFA